MPPRWKTRKEERDSAKERSATPYVSPEPEERVQSESQKRGRGAGLINRPKFQLPAFLQPSQISTPARGNKSGRGERKSAAAVTQLAPDAGDANDGGGKLPSSAPTPTPAPTEDGGSGGSEPRTSVTGLNQYGKTLGGLNQFTKAFTGGYEVEDISKAFKSESLPTTENYSWNAKDNNGGYLEEGTWSEQTNRIESPSTPGTLGGNPDNPQDGTSAKPSVADKVRAIRVGRQSGFDDDDSLMPSPGGDSDNDYPDDGSLVSPMYANERRNKIRRAFLDHEGSSVQAIAAANAVAGYGNVSDGNARFNVGGKLYGAKEGMEYKARNAAMSGENPMQYLDIPATPDTQPDSPEQSTLRISEADGFNEIQQRAQDFFRTKLEERKNK